ncbi:MAG TPA: DUF885 domain-containing protein [Kofleriaceae bacterium]|nr:DUF885 domain-containing protein [Kofleriaceae bacterium]
MSRLWILALVACGGARSARPAEPWPVVSERVLGHLFAVSPSNAVSLGLHDYDGQMPDMSPAAIAANLAQLREDRRALEAVAPATPLEREERDTLVIAVRGAVFNLGDFDVRHTNPMEVAGDFNLDAYILRDYAPATTRAAAIVKVCNAATAHLQQAASGLKLPIPKPWVETAIMMFKGLADFADHDVRTAFQDAPPELGPALDACKSAFLAHAAWLEHQLPNATDAFALGTHRFLEMLEETQGIKIDLATLDKLAHADLDRNTKAIEAAARELDPAKPTAVVVAQVLGDRPAANDVLAVAEQQATELRAFLIDHHIVTVPGDDVALVRPTPPFARWNAASLSGAGPFETTALPSYYYISPPDPAWTPEVQAAYLPSKMTLLFTTIHEVYPGHFIHAMHLHRIHSRIEQALWTYTTGEGWAHYTEEMMYDAGAGGHTPQAHIGQLTEALLRNVRFVVAIGEHTAGLSEPDAEQLFAARAFLDPGNAKQQAIRGTFDPMYLAYTVGKLAIMKMRSDWQARHPQGTLQEFHDAFLAHGGAPLPVIRHALLGDDALL